MYEFSAKYYDALYLSMKDYRKEAARLVEIIHQHQPVGGKCLLDVACGTGLHLAYLIEEYDVQGLDINPEMLAVARERLPGVVLHQADMTDFYLAETYDIITCLFSSIGYVRTLEKQNQAVACMAAHLSQGGILIIEPWFTPDAWKPDTVHASFIDEPELKIARINTSLQRGNLSYFDLHHLVGTPQGTEYFVEHHELGLFTQEEMLHAVELSGLKVSYDSQGLMGRGMYIGKKE